METIKKDAKLALDNANLADTEVDSDKELAATASEKQTLKDIESKYQAASFETVLAKLEKVVQNLESSSTSLDEAMNLFLEGTVLTKICDDKLNGAQRRIKKMLGEVEVDLDVDTASEQ